eukprot:5896709-Pyramimonas_sp.AAC.2
MRTRQQPAQTQRRIGKEGNYDTCGKCGLRGDRLMCENNAHCIEPFHLKCIGSSVNCFQAIGGAGGGGAGHIVLTRGRGLDLPEPVLRY